jgi:hypothetical protein
MKADNDELGCEGGGPDPERLQALDAVLTDEVIDKVARMLKREILALRGAGVPVDEDEDVAAAELVQEAAVQMIVGDRIWHADLPIVTQLYQAARSNISAHKCKAKNWRSRPMNDNNLDDTDPGESERMAEVAKAGPLRSAKPGRAITMHHDGRRLLARLRDRLRPLDALHQLLDAYEAGAQTRGEVMELTGLSGKRFDNLRDRLDRLLKKLGEEEDREIFKDAMEVSHG